MPATSTPAPQSAVGFDVPLYTIGDSARIVDVSASTLAGWAKGCTRRFPDRPEVSGGPVLTYLPTNARGGSTIPFIGLAEAVAAPCLVWRFHLPRRKREDRKSVV